jgi:hypothetical protein
LHFWQDVGASEQATTTVDVFFSGSSSPPQARTKAKEVTLNAVGRTK